MTSLQIRKLTYSALFLALAMVLPFLTGQIPQIGSALSPMHIPALLCGFLCGWPWGLAVGLISPLLRSVIFGMPAMFPGAVAMSFELATYGAVSGLLYKILPRRKSSVYITIVVAMLLGRAVWGIARLILAGLSGQSFTWALFLAGAFTNAVPGIILHLVLVPLLVIVLEKAGLSLNK
ncbi:MAG: ECF transporter S component [Clostridia bacterium]|jgi:riboflavin transporter FmnP|nr:ECF transporter S component [Clostridia bacterium]